jgi:hypothetical protein
MKPLRPFVAALVLTACVPAHSKGVVAMKISDTVAHVCVGKDEVNTGTEIDVLRNVCTQQKPYTCELKRLGTGQITEPLNEHYSVATFPADTGFKEGDLVRVVH